MANFLDNLSEYNAKAAAAISAAVVECNNEKANMMSSLKTTANDVTLSEEVRLNALTALINLGNLLDIALPPYFPSVTTYALTETYVGVHNDLDGLQGGAPGEYYHLTAAEKTSILNKASLGDITWAQLGGVYSDNFIFGPQFDAKQDALSAPDNQTYYVKITGNTIFYDNSVPTASITGIIAGGELTGTYPNPALSNAAVIGKVLTGWNGSVPGTITATDTILSALQKLNANLNQVIASPGGVASVALTNNAGTIFTTTTSPQTGAAILDISLNTQTANLVLASPNGTTGQPSFRSLLAADLPNSGVSAGTYGSSTIIPQIQVDAKGRITGVTAVTAASGGQVNTITLAVPSFLGPSSVNSILPASPQIVLQLATQTANTVFAGPATGAAVVPTFRALVEADIPQLSLTKITGLQDAIANKLDNELNDGEIWIGNDVNAPQTRSLSQDIKITNTGVATIQPNVVTFGKMQQITGANTGVIPNIPGNLLGRWAAGTGNIQEVTLSSDFVLSVSTGTLSLAVPVAPVLTTKGGLITYSQSVGAQVQLSAVYEGRLLMTDSNEDKGIKWVEAQGDIEVNTTLLDGTFNIKSNAVTVGKIQQLPAFTVIGNATSTNPATPTPLTKTQLTTLVNQFTIDTAGGNTALPGVVPGFNINGFPAGKTAADYFLNASGAWSLGGGGSGSGTVNSGTQYRLAYYATTGTAVSEWNAITGSRALVSDGNGLPIASATTATQIGYLSGATGTTGTGNLVLDTSPTLVTPTLGVASATSINKVTITAPATSATLTIANAKTLTASNTLTFTGADGSSVNFPGNGTVAYTTTSNSWSAGVKQTFAPDATNAGINVGSFAGDPSSPLNGDIVYNSSTNNLRAYIAGAWVSLGSGGPGGVTSFQTSLSGLTPSTATTGVVTLAGTLGVASGGTGATTLSGLLRGNGTSAITGSATVALGSEVSGTLITSNGGTGVSTYTAGDILYYTSGTALSKLGIGSVGQILTVAAGNALTWSNGLVNPMTTLGDIITAGAGGVAQRLAVGGAGTFLGIVGGVPAWTTPTGSTPLNQITAAAAGTASINHNASTVTWNWNSNANNALVFNSSSIATAAILSVTSSSAYTGSGVVLISATGVTTGTILGVSHTTSALTGNVASFTSTTVTTGNVLNLGISGTAASSARNLVITNTSTANSTGRGLDISITGNNPNSANSFGAVISINRGTGTSSTNTALQLSAQGTSATNYALDVTNGISRFAAGTASIPQLILTPSSAAGGTTFTGTTNGSLWYDTNTTNSTSSLYLYKDTSATRLIAKDRNEDFATGTSFGVILANTQGSLFKSADLTALGIYAQTNNGPAVTGTTATSIMGTSIVGSTTLPANFFAAGKTIVIRVAGTYQQASSNQACTISLKIGATNVCDVTIGHNNVIGSPGKYWSAEFTVTARGSGGGVALSFEAKAFLDVTTTVGTSGTPVMGAVAPTTAVLASTTTTNLIDIVAAWSNPSASNIIQTIVNTAYYLN